MRNRNILLHHIIEKSEKKKSIDINYFTIFAICKKFIRNANGSVKDRLT